MWKGALWRFREWEWDTAAKKNCHIHFQRSYSLDCLESVWHKSCANKSLTHWIYESLRANSPRHSVSVSCFSPSQSSEAWVKLERSNQIAKWHSRFWHIYNFTSDLNISAVSLLNFLPNPRQTLRRGLDTCPKHLEGLNDWYGLHSMSRLRLQKMQVDWSGWECSVEATFSWTDENQIAFFLRLCKTLSAWCQVEAGSAPSRSAPKHSEMDWFVFRSMISPFFLKGNPVRMVRFCDIWYPRPFAKPEMETSKVWVLPCEGNVWMTQTYVLRRCFWRKKKAILPLSTWLQRRQISTRLVQADQFIPFGDVNLCFVNLPGEIWLDTLGTKVKPSKSKLAPVVEAHHASFQLSDYPPICSVLAEGVQVGLKFDISSKFCCLFNTTTPLCCKLPIGPHPTSCSWSLQLSMVDLLRIQSTKGRTKSKKLPKAHQSYGSQRQILINQSFTL